jgi:glycosyltransferase involved in cell wall biosynthesis
LRWSLEEEYSHIDVIDVGIMPMAGDDLWRRGKCAFKLLQYMARGKPVVASGVGFNRVVVTHGVNGFLAESSEQFYDFLHCLASDPDEARRMGERGAQRVAQEYMLERYVQRLARILVG